MNKNSWRASILLVVFVSALTGFLHFRKEKMEILELGTQAPRYVIAQVDFDFPDEEATLILRQEAVRDIGSIYRIDHQQIHRYRHELETSLIGHEDWRKQLPECTFEQLHDGLDRVEEELNGVRFTDPRTLHRIESIGMGSSSYYPLPNIDRQLPPFQLPSSFWLSLKENAHSDPITYVLNAFAEQLWNVEEDYVLQRIVRTEVQAEVPQKYTHVDAGSQVVRKGETVHPRHLSMLQAMQRALADQKNVWAPLTWLGSFLLAIALTAAALLYIYLLQKSFVPSLKTLTLLTTIILLTLFLSKGVEYLLLYKGDNLIEIVRLPLLVPFAALMTCVLIGVDMALFITIFLVVIFRVALPFSQDFFSSVNLLAGLATIYFAKQLHRRKEVFAVCGKVWCISIPLFFAVNLIENAFWNFNLLGDLLSSFAFMAATAIAVAGILPLLESIFHVMTDMMLMEYMDPSHPLLRRLSLEAPGTYQHGLVVSHLAEEAARAIGANGLFCRVATLYHDIGKVLNPHYFTENQLSGFNIHQLLTPIESTHVIIAHVTDGEALARKHRLPETFIDVIREHHGTTMVYYFYCKQVEQCGGDATKVDEALFRYPGPKPRSKESAIIMLADTFEAASRSMDDVSLATISEMIDKLVSEKAEDGQLDSCQLTFEELGIVKHAMVKALVVTRHGRIKYPE